MPIRNVNLEFLDHNSQRKYPLTIDATCLDVTGDFRLPDDFIVSLYLPVHWGNNIQPGKFFVRSVAAYTTGFAVVVGYAGSDGDVNVASALIARSAHTPNQVYSLGGLGDFADSRGHLIIGDLDGIDQQPNGQFNFDLAGSRIEPDCIRPHLRSVMSIQLQNGSELSPKLYGHIRIRGGRNFRTTAVLEDGFDPEIVLDAIEGEGLSEPCVCTDDRPDPIRTINDIPGDEAGNFALLGNNCVEITPIAHGLVFKDICSEPCCGCKELEVVTQALEAFGDKATTLENFLVSLEERVGTMDGAVLGSKLGDRGCTPECP